MLVGSMKAKGFASQNIRCVVDVQSAVQDPLKVGVVLSGGQALRLFNFVFQKVAQKPGTWRPQRHRRHFRWHQSME